MRARIAAGVLAAVLSVGTLVLSPTGTSLIKKHEGVSQVAYRDAVGVPTICYGSTKNVFIGQRATLAECEARLAEDVTYAGEAVKRKVEVKLTQGQYDALVSFVFNVGPTAFAKSTLLKEINAGRCEAAAAQFGRWVYAKGRKLPGLVTRRADEARLWRTGCAYW